MIQKVANSIIVILCFVVIGLFGLRLLSSRGPAESQKNYSATPQKVDATLNREVLIEEFKSFLTPEELASPEVQKVLELFDSPVGQTFLDSNPSSLTEVLNFFEAHGLAMDKEHFTKEYRQVFPTGEPAALEMEMRNRLTELIRNVDMNPAAMVEGDPGDSYLFDEVVMEFLANRQNMAWMMGQFQGDYQAFGEWVVDVFQNAIPTTNTGTVQGVAHEHEHAPTDREQPLDVTDETIRSAIGVDEAVSTQPSRNKGADTRQETAAEYAKTLVFRLELPSKESLETVLRGQFSPERFNRAMQTLNQYGPEEGLRRLKVSDPEVATHVERLIQTKQEDIK